MSLTAYRAQLAVASTVVVLLAVLAVAAFALLQQYRAARLVLADQEPRIARLLGFGDAGEALQGGLAQTRAQLGRFTHSAELNASQAGNATLQQVRSLAESAGFVVLSSQLMVPQELDGLESIPVSFRLQGPLPALATLLAALPAAHPALLVDNLTVQAPPRAHNTRTDIEPVLAVGITVTALRLQP